MDCDSEAQRAFFHTSDFDKRGSRQSGLHQMELNWYDLVGILLETLRADEVKEMGEIVRNGNTGARKHGIRATPRNKIGSSKEEIEEYPDLRVLDSISTETSRGIISLKMERIGRPSRGETKNLSEDVLAKCHGTCEMMVTRSLSWSRKGNQRATRVTAPFSMSAKNGTTRKRRSRGGQRWWWTCRRGRHQGRPFKGSNWRSSTRLDRLAFLFCDVEHTHGRTLASQSTIFSEPLRLAAADEGCVRAHGEISALEGVPRADVFVFLSPLPWWIHTSAGGAGLGASSFALADLQLAVL